MITSVHIAIQRQLQAVTADIFVKEEYVSGQLETTYVTGVNVNLAIFPVGRKDLQYFPQGEYSFQDKKFYQVTSGTVPDKSIIHVAADKYKVDGGTVRINAGGFVTYLGKRISDSED